MIKIAEILSTGRNTLWDQVKQIGVDHVVTSMPPAVGNEKGWEYMPMLRMKNNFNDAGFDVAVIESTPPMHRIKLGTEGREEELDNVCTFIESMGRVGIKTWCYNWMAILNWT
ncbi:MAG: mannonate dehydratase, partial [Gemmatimonadetes bacterium]|nr:mannonate dehydratase [Gemmatimonadota bacterium]